MKLKAFLLLAFSALLLSPAACSTDGLVGGACAEGHAYCAEVCISILDDETNCGACNQACVRNLACVAGVCGGEDGTAMLPGATGGRGGQGSGGDDMGGSGATGTGASGQGGSGGTGGNSTGGSGAMSGTGGGGGGVCLPPHSTPAACGDCATRCPEEQPNCSPDGNDNYECVANCLLVPFVTQCAGSCVDLDTDALHCGTCSNVCESGICVAGDCVGKTSGHVIALCMSFERVSPSQTNLLANSVFLSARSPVRILAYTRDTSATSKLGMNFALASGALAKGRAYELTETSDPSFVASQLDLKNFEVLMVYDQQGASPGELAAIGATWLDPIQQFSGVGGVVIVAGGGDGVGEMHELISAIELLNATGIIAHDAKDYAVLSPGDAVGINVLSPFRAVEKSCTYSTADVPNGSLVFVITDKNDANLPGVVHQIVVP